MAYPATNRFNYWAQLGILAGLMGAGLIFSGVVQFLLLPIGPGDLKDLENKIFVPENAGILRVIQLFTTLLMFFVPTAVYAWICHKKVFTHLGFRHAVNIKQAVIVIVIMMAALPLSGILSELTEKLPFSKATFAMFREAEDAYNKQINIIGRMDNLKDYLLSLFMLAVLPGIFEEVFFRGGVQNLLSRWWKMPILAIVVTSVIFSAVHGSYFGFLSRCVLGFVLGWMYYRTGNLWLNVIAHGFYNGTAVTVLYISKLRNPGVDLSKENGPAFPWWMGLVSVIVLYGLFVLLEKVSSYQIEKPGEEVLLPVENPDQPSWLYNKEENKPL
ncbi:MAG: CPBP family intramembrane glutamic endopeptidase [Bacteroidota bacterium]